MATDDENTLRRVKRKAKRWGLHDVGTSRRGVQLIDDDGEAVWPDWRRTGRTGPVADAEAWLDSLGRRTKPEESAFLIGGIEAVLAMREEAERRRGEGADQALVDKMEALDGEPESYRLVGGTFRRAAARKR